MEKLKRKYQQTVIAVLLVVLAALLAGKYVLVPLGRHCQSALYAFILGLGFLSAVLAAVNLIISLRFRVLLRRERRESFPDSVEEIRRMGVSTPLDFSYMMVALLGDINPPLIGGFKAWNRGGISTVCDVLLTVKGENLFEEMFGRKPLGYESGDWGIIAQAEYEETAGSSGDSFTPDVLSENVSQEVKRNFKKTTDRISEKKESADGPKQP